MRELLATILSLALVVGVPASALADETKSVSDYCQEASQAETSEAMVQKIHEAFGAMKVEAAADPVRVKEVTPDQQPDLDDGDEEDELVTTSMFGRRSAPYRLRVAIKQLAEP